MSFEGLVPIIQCRHIDKTLAFYQQALRYIIVNKTQTDTGLQWAYIKSDNTYLMLQMSTLPSDQQHSSNIILHYYTKDVLAQHQYMTAKGFNPGEIQDTGYQIRQFCIDDPEGNRITVGQNSNKKS